MVATRGIKLSCLAKGFLTTFVDEGVPICNPKKDSKSEFGGQRYGQNKKGAQEGLRGAKHLLPVEALGLHGNGGLLVPWGPHASTGIQMATPHLMGRKTKGISWGDPGEDPWEYQGRDPRNIYGSRERSKDDIQGRPRGCSGGALREDLSSNKTEKYVAVQMFVATIFGFVSVKFVIFLVKTKNLKKYCVRPNTGVVLPRSTCDVIVKDISPEMFNKEAWHNVEDCKLRVLYMAPPRPLSPVREGSEEGFSPRASVSDNRNISAEISAASRGFVGRYEPQDNSSEARTLISKLTEEKNYVLKQNSKLQQELLDGKIIAPTSYKDWGKDLLWWMGFTKLIGITIQGNGVMEVALFGGKIIRMMTLSMMNQNSSSFNTTQKHKPIPIGSELDGKMPSIKPTVKI
ncbi:hypothetical protein Dsin_028780 [Dipteronia sinensis]|uniref:MSP domain-containing protein n=1 Tax=Dipteronia sinensis TaxID=43782 RepID=A0AAE0DUY1_9ROSI|nr:hypothetical protein Dsin_028780 [Dipteronia sinensis]